jgi:uncharacterized protein YdiU (UPF0061 family)
MEDPPLVSHALTRDPIVTMHSEAIPFDNSYARLPERFFARLAPTPVSGPRLVRLNDELARQLGVDPEYFAMPQGVDVLAGNRVPESAEPLAMAYAGFQFGNWVPQLGDGRAILLGELIDRDGIRHDVQLKGAGPTPFSRRGDGRAGLGPVLREYIVSEAMAALGVATTRSLAVVTTGDSIMRETAVPGAILTRVALSHVRVGTFQFFAGRQDVEAIRALADHVIARHYPSESDSENPYIALLRAVIDRQAELVASWQAIGFIHGVMNTDNVSIAGETIDYGPCAFMDAYHPDTVFSSIDRMGRYAYKNQPSIAHWNLVGLAEALLPILGADQDAAIEAANEALQAFPGRFEYFYRLRLQRKLGLGDVREGDAALAGDLLNRMAENKADFTLSFRRLCEAVDEDARGGESVRSLFENPQAFDDWAVGWRRRLVGGGRSPAEVRNEMRAANPAFIPRNHLVEEVIRAGIDAGDFEPFARIVEVLGSPYDEQPGNERYAAPPTPDQIVRETFCGT